MFCTRPQVASNVSEPGGQGTPWPSGRDRGHGSGALLPDVLIELGRCANIINPRTVHVRIRTEQPVRDRVARRWSAGLATADGDGVALQIAHLHWLVIGIDGNGTYLVAAALGDGLCGVARDVEGVSCGKQPGERARQGGKADLHIVQSDAPASPSHRVS